MYYNQIGFIFVIFCITDILRSHLISVDKQNLILLGDKIRKNIRIEL